MALTGLAVPADDRKATGRTPPPAPSAAFARRAQIMAEDEPGSSYGSNYRRARAGTMPSALTPTDAPVRTSALSPAYPHITPPRPHLRHSNSSAPSLEHVANPVAVSRAGTPGRARSGSLTSDIDAAFGVGMFGLSAHAPAPASTARSPLGQDDAADLSIDTLDYLGLADGAGSGLAEGLGPSSVSELRDAHRRAIEHQGPASRHRSSTVSTARRPVTHATPYSRDHDHHPHNPDSVLTAAMDQLNMYDSVPLSLLGPSLLNRPRATTVGALDHPILRKNPYLASIPQSPVDYYPRSRSDRDLTRSRDSSVSRVGRLSMDSRTGTPDGSSTPQMPTRSLWIGNLDVGATNQSLIEVFSQYGAIESVRMLPEKTCAFVNFYEKTHAIYARDDVLNRLGGHLPNLSETAAVRIGFGKIDSAPAAVPTSTVAPAPPGLVFTNGLNSALTSVPATPEQSDQSSLPTRALWIGSIPSTTSSATLLQIFTPFGPVESARVLQHKSCGFVNFERVDSAIAARNALNGRDILGSDVGPIRIGFGRVPSKSPVLGGPDDESPTRLEGLGAIKGATSVSAEQQLSAEGGGVENYRSQLVLDLVKAGVHEQVLEKGLATGGEVSEQQMIMQVLSGGRVEEDGDVRAAADVRPPASYYTSIPPPPDRREGRRSEAPRLRDLRKRLDSGLCPPDEVNAIARELMDDSAELAADYIGNTVIQKLFERCSPDLRFAMLERIAPTLAMIGIHKNGTWAAQKIIECARTAEERRLISVNLRPFAPPLMCDSLGNYVCAGTLRFGEPDSDYVYDAMIDRMWDIAQNRFGARCMRTCLESPHTSLYQKKRIAASIILNSIPLATNPNGALLLTWLVEQSNLPGRYGLLANRFIPHIAHLATHKLASLTVLRIVSQPAEPSAAAILVQAMFQSPADGVLTEVLSDASNGSQVIGKILNVNTLPADQLSSMRDAVRRVLPNIKGTQTPPYRRLLEDLGLPVPAMPPHQPHAQQYRPWYQVQPGMGGVPGMQALSGVNGNYGLAAPPMPGYGQPLYGMPNPGLSPLMVPHNMPLGQMRAASPSLTASPRTPVARQRGRLSPASMLSPGSDPFNPFASPSIDIPYMQQQGLRLGPSLQPSLTGQAQRFEAQPNVGGLGIMPAQDDYYAQRASMYAPAYQ
ncbi:hypothetical protein Q5752_005045 [Cryptotrichosporon argae]